MGKANHKGRSTGDPKHARLYGVLVDGPAYRSLGPYARSLYTELKLLYSGSNNGEIYLAVRRAADRLGTVQFVQGGENAGQPVEPRIGAPTAKATVEKAFAELLDRGFIKVSRRSSFDFKEGRATRWTLTEYPLGAALATKDYQRWTPSPESSRPRRLTPQQRKTRSHQTDAVSHQTDAVSHQTDMVSGNGPMGRDGIEENRPSTVPSHGTDIVYQVGAARSTSASAAQARLVPVQNDPDAVALIRAVMAAFGLTEVQARRLLANTKLSIVASLVERIKSGTLSPNVLSQSFPRLTLAPMPKPFLQRAAAGHLQNLGAALQSEKEEAA